MAKWADYCISAVRYSYSGKHIDKVRVHTDDGQTIGPPTESTRTQVITAIEAGRSFVTIYARDDKWRRGEDVRIVKVNGNKYIRTDANSKEEDNLGDLPKF